MPNGARGDSPVTDMLSHGLHPFPADMETMLREILALDPGFPDGKRRWVDQVAWVQRFSDWEAGRNLDEGREAMKKVLTELHAKKWIEDAQQSD